MKTTFTILISLIFILSGCKQPEKPCSDVLTHEEANSLPYVDHQKLAFKNNSGIYDTIHCTKGYTITNYTESDYDCTSGPRAVYFFLGFCTITKNHAQPIDISFNVPSVGLHYYVEGSTQNNITIDSVIYNDVYVLSKDSTSVPADKPWKIYYTNLNGIIKYNCINNVFWERTY